MKILVISLLRLGDILLATSVIRSLRKSHPEAELHILINKQFAKVADLIPSVDRVYFFDRTGLQNLVGHKDHNLLEAYFRVEDLVEELRSQKFDRVINLTHNRLSGWITTLLECPNTQGVVFRKDGGLNMGSGWFEYLNDQAEVSDNKPFHFVDIFHYGTGLNLDDRRLELKESDRGKKFADKIQKEVGTRKLILVQPGSHEIKKTLSSSAWKKALVGVREKDRNCEIRVLGSPDELQLIQSICENAEGLSPLVCELDEAYSVLKRAQLLVTTDTSIKHMAASAGTRIIEISVGSSDYRKTGSFTDGAIIIQGLAPCAPCSHSKACDQVRHICGDHVDPELLTMAIGSVLNRDDASLRVLAHEYRDHVTILRTSINSVGDWAAYPLASEFSSREIGSWVDRSSKKLHLSEGYKKSVAEYGTEGVELKRLLQNIYPEQSPQEWQQQLKGLETEFEYVGNRLVGLMKKLKFTLAHFGDDQRMKAFVNDYRDAAQSLESSIVFNSFGRELKYALELSEKEVPFTMIAKMREKLSRAYQRYKIELKLIRCLQTDFMEIL